jgi:soluble lytic murein transglycosylase-like protein
MLAVIVSTIAVVLSSFSFARAEITINLAAIKTIESDGNAYAFNQRTKCYGLYQISEICLKDFNLAHQTDYTGQDLFIPMVNEAVAAWYFAELKRMLDYYEIPVSLSTVIAAYNWGIGNVVKWHKNGADFTQLPQETRNYIEKYQRLAPL